MTSINFVKYGIVLNRVYKLQGYNGVIDFISFYCMLQWRGTVTDRPHDRVFKLGHVQVAIKGFDKRILKWLYALVEWFIQRTYKIILDGIKYWTSTFFNKKYLT